MRQAAALAAGLVLAAGCSDSPPSAEPPAGSDAPEPASAYAPGWSAVHADSANTDFSTVDGADDLTLAWQRSFEGSVTIGALDWTINLGPTVGPDGRVYLTSTVTGCHLQALDGATGETLWCSPDVGPLAVASSALLDRDGRLFVADAEAMHAFDTDGRLLWETPIVGVPLSAQFTPEGRLVFVSHVGNLYVLDRATGESVLPTVELVPGATWDPAGGMMACARGTEACPAANTLAVDQATGRLVFTFWEPGAPQAGIRAMRYTEEPEPTLTTEWTNDSLPGGSASSPVLSADGSRVYVNDNVDSMHALDARTGEEIWTFPIGFASGGSPSLSPGGIIMPAGGGGGALLALHDDGDAASLAWRHDDIVNRGLPTQAAGDRVYATVGQGGARNELLVLDAVTGTELDREALPGSPVFTVGTTVGPDGTVYVPAVVGELYAFTPS
jgi:outer membrane protein assembly factor BamB